jgi:hypothetical protein
MSTSININTNINIIITISINTSVSVNTGTGVGAGTGVNCPNLSDLNTYLARWALRRVPSKWWTPPNYSILKLGQILTKVDYMFSYLGGVDPLQVIFEGRTWNRI